MLSLRHCRFNAVHGGYQIGQLRSTGANPAPTQTSGPVHVSATTTASQRVGTSASPGAATPTVRAAASRGMRERVGVKKEGRILAPNGATKGGATSIRQAAPELLQQTSSRTPRMRDQSGTHTSSVAAVAPPKPGAIPFIRHALEATQRAMMATATASLTTRVRCARRALRMAFTSTSSRHAAAIAGGLPRRQPRRSARYCW
mmetsp:Transcript_86045/g.257877  ORF Transcript_86045/g.257877 Transcript_86045/m.257877 type:complete len:202 (+) Transcript_86045:208-813(+)